MIAKDEKELNCLEKRLNQESQLLLLEVTDLASKQKDILLKNAWIPFAENSFGTHHFLPLFKFSFNFFSLYLFRMTISRRA